MEFRVERGAFAEAVGWAARALPARSPVPVLGGLLLTADAGRLSVSGFDFEAPRVRLELLGAGQRTLLTAVADGGERDTAHRHLLMSVKQLV